MKLLLIILSALVISACSSTGMRTAGHNGLRYYIPDNCSKYTYYHSDPNELYCINNGQQTGQKLYPVSQEQIANHQRQKSESQERSNEINRALQEFDDQIPKTTYTNCIGRYGYLNCTSTTP